MYVIKNDRDIYAGTYKVDVAKRMNKEGAYNNDRNYKCKSLGLYYRLFNYFDGTSNNTNSFIYDIFNN